MLLHRARGSRLAPANVRRCAAPVLQCVQDEAGPDNPKVCKAFAEDYMECLHHRKFVSAALGAGVANAALPAPTVVPTGMHAAAPHRLDASRKRHRHPLCPVYSSSYTAAPTWLHGCSMSASWPSKRRRSGS